MKIIVDRMPDIPCECLFSNWDCEFGWICGLYNCKHYPELLGLYSDKCELVEKSCPYLQAERRNEN